MLVIMNINFTQLEKDILSSQGFRVENFFRVLYKLSIRGYKIIHIQ